MDGGRGWYKLKVKPTWERMSKLKHNLDLDILRQVAEYQSYSWGGGGRSWYKLKVKPTWERISKLKLNLDVKVPKLELYFKFGPSSITPAVALVLWKGGRSLQQKDICLFWGNGPKIHSFCRRTTCLTSNWHSFQQGIEWC